MTEERITLSKTELDRVSVIHSIIDRWLTPARPDTSGMVTSIDKSKATQ